MERLADLLSLWSALAAAEHRPGRVRRLAAGAGMASEGWRHPEPTAVVALAGVVRIEAPGSPPCDLRPGDLLAIPAGAAHRHAPLRGGAIDLQLGFEFGWCDFLLRAAGGATLVATMPRQPAETLVGRLLEGDAAARAGLLALILARPLAGVQPLPPAALRMRDHLRNHGLAPIGAADLARASGLRPSRAWQLFRASFGCTPRQALERRRCAIAARLLAEGMGVDAAGRRCGYRDRGTFTRAFRRVHGRPPSAARG